MVLPAKWQAAFNDAAYIGQFFGGFLCGRIADTWGRRPALALAIAICVGATFFETFAPERGAFLISKLIFGTGVGFLLSLAPLMASELAPIVLRGYCTAGVNLGISLGQLMSSGVTLAFGSRKDLYAFRAPFLTQLAISILLGTGCYLSPESPWDLVRTGRVEKARMTLERLYGQSTNVDTKLLTIQSTIDAECEQCTLSIMSSFHGTNRKRTLVCIWAFACQHISGVVFVFGFSTYFFELAGLPSDVAFAMGIGNMACGVISCLCSWYFIHRLGHRRIFNWGMAGLTVILLLIGMLDFQPTRGIKWIQASLTVLFTFVYESSIGCVAFALLGEVSTLALRAQTTALCTATQAVCAIAMFSVVPYMVSPDEAVSVPSGVAGGT